MPPAISIIVPVYNEEDNVPPLAQEIIAAFRAELDPIELIFVDDGSTDGTWDKIGQAQQADAQVRGVRHERNAGQSAALWTGLQLARAPIIGTLDGDLQNDPIDLPRLLARLDDADFVCGVRLRRQDNWLRRSSAFIARLARRAALGVDFRDAGCSLRVFRRTAITGVLPFNGWHRFLPVLAHWVGARVLEVPVNHRPRTSGTSKYGVWNRLGRGIWDLMGVAWYERRRLRPVPFSEAPSQPAQAAPDPASPIDDALPLPHLAPHVTEDSEMTSAVNGPTSTPITELAVSGMSCNNCARHVAEALEAVPQVAGVNVRLEEGRATIRWQPNADVALNQLVSAVSQAGYQAQAIDLGQSDSETLPVSPLHAWRFNVIFGAALTLPLILGEWALGLGHTPGFKWFGFAAATPVLFVCGRGFFRGAWQQLKRGHSNMDTLVALGSSTAYGYSLWGLLAGWPGHLYFMEAAAIITLISAGHWMEALASRRATHSLRALMDLTPPTTRRLDSSQAEEEIPVAQLRAGDQILLKPGERVPTDGEVIEGHSAVDESMLTGESRPVEKSAGQSLFGGTAVQDGRLVMRVTATGETTALAQIIAVVQRAQNSRANIQKLGDKVSSIFVPIVVLIAILTGLWWGLGYQHALQTSGKLAGLLWHVTFPASALAAAFIHAAAVLIVACPCAMGLATPAAIMAGTNAAARRGILIRDGIALEKSGRITAVVFDKTGTLTQGKLAVAAVEPLGEIHSSVEEIQQLAARLAQPSNHPLSRAIASLDAKTDSAVSGSARVQPFVDWRELRGRGVEAALRTQSGSTFRLGSLAWLREIGIDLAGTEAFAEHWSSRGATVLGVARDQRLLGLFALQDALKPNAAEVVRNLRGAGTHLYLMSGDQKATSIAIAHEAGIEPDHVYAEVRPEDKSRIVAELQQRGERVAFVGDGINDAPALEQADLGIAVSKASDVAREAADIILLNSDIQAIPEAIHLAQATLRTIKQNLFWAFFYNAAAIPLAALGFLSPVLCALAMGLSDLVVIGNALRLRAWKQRL